jgi:hypothetical protein
MQDSQAQQATIEPKKDPSPLKDVKDEEKMVQYEI